MNGVAKGMLLVLVFLYIVIHCHSMKGRID